MISHEFLNGMQLAAFNQDQLEKARSAEQLPAPVLEVVSDVTAQTAETVTPTPAQHNVVDIHDYRSPQAHMVDGEKHKAMERRQQNARLLGRMAMRRPRN